jgi:hypothetical protein
MGYRDKRLRFVEVEEHDLEPSIDDEQRFDISGSFGYEVVIRISGLPFDMTQT